jgi:hypothetical protein
MTVVMERETKKIMKSSLSSRTTKRKEMKKIGKMKTKRVVK